MVYCSFNPTAYRKEKRIKIFFLGWFNFSQDYVSFGTFMPFWGFSINYALKEHKMKKLDESFDFTVREKIGPE
jgi:hypothetical protein